MEANSPSLKARRWICDYDCKYWDIKQLPRGLHQWAFVYSDINL